MFSSAFALIVLLAWILQRFLATDIALVGMIESVLQMLLFGAFIFFPLCVLFRRWRGALLLVPLLILFVIAYGRLFVPRAQAGEGDLARSIMTFNIQAPEDAIGSIIAVIRDSGADIVAVQELTSRAAARFDAELAELYPYQALHPRDNDNAGQGVLSRMPILDDEYWRLESLDTKLGHQRVVVDWDGTPVTLFNTHPVPPLTQRGFSTVNHTIELTDVLNRAEAVDGPVVIVGDFNMSEAFDLYQRFTERYTDAYAEVGQVGFGFTFPQGRFLPFPIVRLDYVFYDAAFRGVEARVWPDSGGSDHLPVLARLILDAG